MLGTILVNAVNKDLSEARNVVRLESNLPENIIQKRLDVIHGLISSDKLRSLVSTCIDNDTSTGPLVGGNIEIHFDNARGRVLGDYSFYPEENELLMPPCHVKWRSVEEQGDKTIYHASVVEPHIDEASMTRKPTKYKHRQLHGYNQFIQKGRQPQHTAVEIDHSRRNRESRCTIL